MQINFIARALARRSIFSWLFEVLPIWLLALQSMVALSTFGDVDGRSAEPLFSGFGRPLGALSGANQRLNAFLGRWSIQERHNIDEFMEALGFGAWQRALIARAGQSYVLEHGMGENGDTLKIVTQDLRGKSQLELPLSGKGVQANDGDGGQRVERSVEVQRTGPPAVVMKERFLGESEPYSVCKRTLQPDGRMRIDVTKKTPGGKSVAMRAIAARSS